MSQACSRVSMHSMINPGTDPTFPGFFADFFEQRRGTWGTSGLSPGCLRLRALAFDVGHFDRAVGEIARDAAGVRQPPGLSGFEFDILRLAVRHGETNAAPGDADEHAGAVVVQRYR